MEDKPQLGWPRARLTVRDPAKNTPAVQEWLCKVEATLNRDLSRMEAELAVFGYTVIGPVREVAAP